MYIQPMSSSVPEEAAPTMMYEDLEAGYQSQLQLEWRRMSVYKSPVIECGCSKHR